MRAVIVAGGCAAAAAVFCGAVLLWPHAGTLAHGAPVAARASSPTAGPTAAGPAVPLLKADEASALSAELASGQAEQVRRAVLVPTGQPLPPELPAELASLGPLTFDLATFAADPGSSAGTDGGPETATVTATTAPTGAAPARWTVRLVRDSTGSWKVATTEKQP